MRYKYLILSILLILASINLTRTTLEIMKSSQKLDTAKAEITKLDEERQKLESDITYKKSDDFVDKIAREELNMVKPGEKVYIVKDIEDGTTSRQVVESDVLGFATDIPFKKLTIEKRTENIKAWIELFF